MTLAIIGMGYVGLPLAIAFGKRVPVLGFDINMRRIQELQIGYDSCNEVLEEDFAEATQLSFTTDARELAQATTYIVTVPSPIDTHKQPDLRPLLLASETIGRVLKPGDIVIYESSVYPGCTEDDCVPVLEKLSGLTLNLDFFVGYSPERINPGDKKNRLENIIKVTAGSTPEAAIAVDELYASIITAGTHKAPSIRVAEAAKIIENTQRDLNIALVNELAMIFNRMGIDTRAVLEAAETKWNFLPFRPGLVGGHCIGVDPYYLTHKAQAFGYHPEVILAGRRVNDGMGRYVASELIKAMLRREMRIAGSRVLLLGLTFKENCPDLRNTRVVDVINELRDYNLNVDVYDPWANPDDAMAEYGLALITHPKEGYYDAVIIAVPHDEFRALGVTGIRALGAMKHVIYDLKYLLPAEETDLKL